MALPQGEGWNNPSIAARIEGYGDPALGTRVSAAVRSAVLGVSVRRPSAARLSARGSTALRRRMVVGVLVVIALGLITISFRQGEDGRARAP